MAREVPNAKSLTSLKQDAEFFRFWRTLQADGSSPGRIDRLLRRMFSLKDEFLSEADYLTYLRCLFTYDVAGKIIPRRSVVLDIGCGAGYGTTLLAGCVSLVKGIDVNPQTVEYAGRKYGRTACSFRTYDGVRIPYADSSFDAAVSFQVIEHIRDDARFIAEADRVLKKGGIFLLTTPNRLLSLKPGQRPWNRFHVREYSPETFEGLLRTAFGEVRIWGIKSSEKVQRLEFQRLSQHVRLDTLDPFHLRDLVPESIKPTAIEIARKILFRVERDFSPESYSLGDFHIEKADVAGSLDLFAVCRK